MAEYNPRVVISARVMMVVARWLALCAITLVSVPGCYLHRDPESLRVAIAVPELPGTLDPHIDDHIGTRYVHAAIFDALTVVDEKGTLRPALATSWQPIGPTTWEFKLRHGVRFHSGEEFTAHTVAHNVRRVLRPDLRSPVMRDVPTLLRANPRDLYTVVISTRRPDPILPRRLAALFMVPAEYLQRVGEDRFSREPSGTGPWGLASFSADEHVTLEARKGSWRGAPQVRTIQLRQLTAEADRLEALASGSVQLAFDLPAAPAAALRARGVEVQEAPVGAVRLITLDTTADEAPLSDGRVRQALNYAIDKEALIDTVVGAGIPLDGQVVGKEAYGYSDRVTATYPYEPERARRLLAEAGFANGFAMRIHYPASSGNREQRELRVIANYLEQVRVRISLQAYEPGIHAQRRLAGLLSPAIYETLPYYPTLDASAVMEFFGLDPSQGFTPTYDNHDFEEIYKLTRSETTAPIRLQALQIAMGILADSPPAIYLYQPVRIHAMQRGVTDFRASPTLLFDFDRLSR